MSLTGAELLETWNSPQLLGHIVGNYDVDRAADIQQSKGNPRDIISCWSVEDFPM